LLDRHLEAIMKVLLIYDSESVPVDIAIYVWMLSIIFSEIGFTSLMMGMCNYEIIKRRRQSELRNTEQGKWRLCVFRDALNWNESWSSGDELLERAWISTILPVILAYSSRYTRCVSSDDASDMFSESPELVSLLGHLTYRPWFNNNFPQLALQHDQVIPRIKPRQSYERVMSDVLHVGSFMLYRFFRYWKPNLDGTDFNKEHLWLFCYHFVSFIACC
jgi:hypothetical protein